MKTELEFQLNTQTPSSIIYHTGWGT